MSNSKKVEKINEMIPLNEKLYDEFFMQELELRLETDPLLVGGLVDFLNPNVDSVGLQVTNLDCPELQTCGCFCNNY
jgi:hypothetical protein